MASSSSPSSYDPNVIIKAAEERQASNDFEGAQMIFQSALLDWVDDAREGNSHQDAESLQVAISTLWIAYAHFLARHKQYKSATEAYEQAAVCPVAGVVGRVWLEYARFAEERGKLKTAQDVYLRALRVVTDEQDQTLLWQEFLEMMRKSNPDLTLSELQSAVVAQQQEQHSGVVSTNDDDGAPEHVLSGQVAAAAAMAAADASSEVAPPPAKRLRLLVDSTETGRSIEQQLPSKTHVVTAESVNMEAKAFGECLSAENGVPSDLAAAWMLRDGNDPAQPPEPPLFEPSPPKLSDPTARDILGVDLALSLVERILSPSGPLLLEVCRGLWALHSLQERKTTQAIDMLDQTMKQEMEKMERNLDARLSAVTGATAVASLRQMNDSARREFQTTCGQQRQNLLSGIAWEFRQLLAVQQQVLTKMKVPGFEGPTVDAGALNLQARICSYLHSAFYLRSRVGEGPHVNMLKGHCKLLQKEQDQQPGGRTWSPPPLAGLSQSAGPFQQFPPPPPLPPTGYIPQQQPQQQFMLGTIPPPQNYASYQGQGPTMGNQQPPQQPQGGYGNQQYPTPPYY